ncbi:hypothetical protein [Streptomyces sp. RKAG290]|uniref:hypothetical protein n=1 Tax=Streptomyces sp. RKAG290 TaxID=2888348 RepID=UPI0020342EA3|nr:hypothetical protein [Streptomyces sp. RKAG290]MCM2413076.1 hypothetical protein [Streptomyces sp. RKAG290]
MANSVCTHELGESVCPPARPVSAGGSASTSGSGPSARIAVPSCARQGLRDSAEAAGEPAAETGGAVGVRTAQIRTDSAGPVRRG